MGSTSPNIALVMLDVPDGVLASQIPHLKLQVLVVDNLHVETELNFGKIAPNTPENIQIITFNYCC